LRAEEQHSRSIEVRPPRALAGSKHAISALPRARDISILPRPKKRGRSGEITPRARQTVRAASRPDRRRVRYAPRTAG
jgi:hypothetical protein